MTISEAMSIAIQHHQAGRLSAAERIYRQVLEAEPNQADAIHLLGVLAQQAGRFETAVEYIRRAIGLNGTVAEFHLNLAKVFESIARPSDAIDCYRRALELNPESVEMLSNLGHALRKSANWESAIGCYRRALDLKPDSVEAHNDLGNVFRDQGNLDAAEGCYRRALECKPGFAGAHNNLGLVFKARGKLEEAMTCYRRAIELEPDFAEAHGNLGMMLLLLGRYEEGWKAYEHRFAGEPERRRSSKPRWQGEPAAGRTILIRSEQGFGDVLQFMRYAPLVRAQAGAERILVEVHPAMVRLLAGSGGWDAEILVGADAAYDCHIPMLSLPLALGRFEPLIMNRPYLRAGEEVRRLWRERLGAAAAPRVGLVWAGNPALKLDRLRSMPAETLRPLLQMPGFQFYSVQLGPPSLQAQPLEAASLIDLTAHITDFADTAAFVAELDLVISVDTAVAHLTGAMGRPVWTLLPFQAEWRWGLAGETTPWYPTMRLFRQSAPGDWEAVVHRIAASLRMEFHQGLRP